MTPSSTNHRRVALVGLILALVAIGWWRLGAGKSPMVVSVSGLTMGTTFSVKYLPPGPEQARSRPREPLLGGGEEEAASAIRQALDHVVRSMSTWEPDSEISRLNAVEAGVPQALSKGFADVLALAIEVNRKTMGAFDPTVRPLLGAYGFGSSAAGGRIGESELSAIRKRVGIELVEFDRDSMTMTKRIPDVELDFGGIAKGYGVDRVAEALDGLGITDYMVEVGGEIRVRGGRGPGSPWNLAIEAPLRETRQLHAIVRLPEAGGALATSGDYRNFREVDGRIVSHLFDPRTGEPVVRRTASVSVVRPTAAEADALATALGVLTPEEAIDLADQEGWAVYILLHDGQGGFSPRMSRAFEGLEYQRIDGG